MIMAPAMVWKIPAKIKNRSGKQLEGRNSGRLWAGSSIFNRTVPRFETASLGALDIPLIHKNRSSRYGGIIAPANVGLDNQKRGICNERPHLFRKFGKLP